MGSHGGRAMAGTARAALALLPLAGAVAAVAAEPEPVTFTKPPAVTYVLGNNSFINAGNEIVRFGTWGNRDSMGGLLGDTVPTKDIPIAWPNSVDATDDYIYVGDMGNCRLLRIAKTFVATETVDVKEVELP